jgi:hypothetical protein
MIIVADRKYIAASFDNEEEIERVVIKHAEYIFGPDSIILPKSIIRSADGFGTIPDGFAIDFAARRWFIVEAELSSHSVWGHIAPQVSKQIVAAQQQSSRKLLIEVVINRIREDEKLRERIEELGIPEIDIRQVLTEIMESRPIIGIPIDHVSSDLREWAQTLKNEVKLWIVRKLVDFRDPTQVLYEIPDEFRPVFDSANVSEEAEQNAYYDVTISDLLAVGKLKPEQLLFMSYKPRDGSRETYQATVTADGNLMVDGHFYSAPSFAALYYIQRAGSHRYTVNGWKSWKTVDGRTIADLRDEYLSEQKLPKTRTATSGGA